VIGSRVEGDVDVAVSLEMRGEFCVEPDEVDAFDG